MKRTKNISHLIEAWEKDLDVEIVTISTDVGGKGCSLTSLPAVSPNHAQKVTQSWTQRATCSSHRSRMTHHFQKVPRESSPPRSGESCNVTAKCTPVIQKDHESSTPFLCMKSKKGFWAGFFPLKLLTKLLEDS